MNDLEEKYKRNDLTPEELKQLRKIVNNTSDEKFEESMYESWQKDILNESQASAECLTAIKNKIDATLFPKRILKLPSRLGWIAAAVLLPIFILTTFYFYQEKQALSSGEVLFSTLKGERANVTLPDGTKVTMNSGSSLRYSPAEFNNKERCINFNGEAYFDVAKNKTVPFIINTADLKVKVLGTKFNLHAYVGNETMELTLETGHVLVSSRKEKKELFPRQKAVLNCADGKISIVKDDIPENASVWKNGELIFIDEELENVVKALEKNYEVSIYVESGSNMNSDLFTGRMPTEDLLNALEILKYSYHMNYHISGKDIHFQKK